jgi:membrane-associated phospholipid phosphatase
MQSSWLQNRPHTWPPKGATTRAVTWFLAPNDDRPPVLFHRLTVFVVLFIPWLVLYETVVYLGPPAGAFQTYLPGEMHWPIWQWMEVLYVSPYVLVTLVPFAINTNRLLRRFTLAGILATIIGHLIFLSLPAIAPPRPFEPHGLLGSTMLLDRRLDLNNGTAAFPSFHAFWALLGASVCAAEWPRLRYVGWAWAVGVCMSCVFTGMHATVDVGAGLFLYLVTWFHVPILHRILQWLNRQFPRLGGLRWPGCVEVICNILIVAVMLEVTKRSVVPAVALALYLVLWMLARLVHASVVQVISNSAKEPRSSRARDKSIVRIRAGAGRLSAMSSAG